jgi:NADPH:quinone reductase-like Zn-dependent oxidoreductase
MLSLPGSHVSVKFLVLTILSALVLYLTVQKPLFTTNRNHLQATRKAMAARTMRAIVVHNAGGPEVLKLHHDYPVPVPQNNQVLIHVKAFGLNRAEMFTRQGHSPGVVFPRVLGIEATGVVDAAPSGEFQPGDVVVTAMGNMGRAYDGGYAEYTCVNASQVKRISHKVSWEILGALPETMQTAYGSLFTALQLNSSDNLLIRGGTTTIGLAAATLAKAHGAFVVSTTRKPERTSMLRENGADDVIIDSGSIVDEVKKRYPDGFSKVLELVGVTTMTDSLKCLKMHGTQCMTGIAGGKWTLENFTPIGTIPKGRYLTSYGGSSDDLLATPIDDIAKAFEEGRMKMPIKTFRMEDIVEAHRFMEHEGGAKVVVLT